jgi:hypothetical protein
MSAELRERSQVADAGMISEANQKAITAAGLSFILGTRIAYVPQVICEWRDNHPGEQIPDGQVFTEPVASHGLGEGSGHPRPGDLLPVPPRPGSARVAWDR